MVMSCCKYCYIKYIDSNGEIDEKQFKSLEKGNFYIIKEPLIFPPPKKSFWMFLQREKPTFENPVQYRYKKIENGKITDICSCDCHRKDLTVLH